MAARDWLALRSSQPQSHTLGITTNLTEPVKPLLQDNHGRISNSLLLSLLFGKGGLGDAQLNSWLSVFVRKIDVATDEYQIAYGYWKEDGRRDDSVGTVVISIPAAGDHLELCIISVRRALRCLDKIISAPDARAIDRLLRRRIEHATKGLIEVRNVIEHIDKEIAKVLSEGTPHTMRISDDGQTAAIANQELKIEDLRHAIVLLRELANELATQRCG